ncbi:MAG: 50S ribosomal protein L11 methyltransferase [Sphingomonadales bacterium]
MTFSPVTAEQTDWLIALLSEAGYEGFEEKEQALLAYIPSAAYNESQLAALASEMQLTYSVQHVEPINWNQQWESNFDPVTIDSFLHIRAAFHPPFGQATHELVITPKMSFGTGHHATTRLMASEMRQLDLNDKTVFDFGTGTGVLAILAEKMGASRVIAIDNDSWSLQNAAENIEANQCSRIELSEGAAPLPGVSADIIVANINLSILTEHMRALVRMVLPGGQLVLSGILEEDISTLLPVCEQEQLRLLSQQTLLGWSVLRLAY